MAKKSKKNNGYTFSFQAPAGHVSTSGKLLLIAGRKTGGVDVYANLEGLAASLGADLPDSYDVQVTITPAKGAGELVEPLAVVPRTLQSAFTEAKTPFSEIYGQSFTEYLESLLAGDIEEQPAKPPKANKPATTTRTRKAKPEPEALPKAAKSGGKTGKATCPAPGTAPGSEASSLIDRVNGLESGMSAIQAMLGELLER